MRKGEKLRRAFWYIVGIAAAAIAVYCMTRGLGLVDGLDFGAGAYYYADIPQFAKYVDTVHFVSDYSMPVHIGLFLLWGFLMFKAWVWMDRKLK